MIQQLAGELDKAKLDVEEAIKNQVSAEWILQLFNQQGDVIERLWSPCAHMNAVIGSDEWRECYRQGISLLSAFDTYLHQNKALYQLLDKSQDKLTAGFSKMREDFLLNCRLSGIDLDADKKKKVEQLIEELDELSQDFQNHVTDSQKQFRFHTEDETMLAGIPQHILENAKKQAQKEQVQGFVLGLEQPTYMAIVSYAHDAKLRQLYFEAYGRRASFGEFDNTPLIQAILEKRQQLAQLVGLKDYASYSLMNKMAKKVPRVERFLDKLLQAILPISKKDMATLEAYAQSKGQQLPLKAWDTSYYLQMRQQEIFDIDQEALRDYFPLSQVMHGLDTLLQKLYGIHLQKQVDADVWHPEVDVYALCQGDKKIGWVYCDWFARKGKRGGAWMDTLQTRCLTKTSDIQLAVTTLTCNFAEPIPGHEAGLTHEELLTLLHEFGHCLHHLLSEVDEFSLSGVHSVEWDAVELPSQWMENWGWEETWVKLFSKHVKTGLPLPHKVFEQLLAMKNDMVGLYLLRQVLFALYDMSIHNADTPKDLSSVNNHYLDLLKEYAVWPYDPNARFPQSFSHIFAGGYAAGYYSYLWADVLSCDAFAWFAECFDKITECGTHFRKTILSKGGSCSALEAFIAFRGREPDENALLKSYGLVS